jgi:chorismate dehydratase
LYGLEAAGGVKVLVDVPSRLLCMLQAGEYDVALLPVIDFQRHDALQIVPSGGICCDGPTLTVRIFSRVPIAEIRSLACDTESHTSVALVRILLAEAYGIRPELMPLSPVRNDHDARLLIGDKVIQERSEEFAFQLDLGEAWKILTGLPFVFAVWTSMRGVDLRDLPQRLAQARFAGVAAIGEIVAEHAQKHGWPGAVAYEYLSRYLKFEIGTPQLQAIRRFHELAARYDIIDRVRDLEVYSGAAPQT